jgi:hypothetical protein
LHSQKGDEEEEKKEKRKERKKEKGGRYPSNKFLSLILTNKRWLGLFEIIWIELKIVFTYRGRF